MRSAVLQEHLLSVNGDAISDAFLDVILPPREKINVSRSKILDAVNIICPPAVFDAYADEYLQRDDLFTSATLQNSLKRFVGILRGILQDAHGNEFYDGNDDHSISAPQRYVAPAFVPRSNLSGTNLTEKSTFAEKLHAIDLIIDNPGALIAYAALDAIISDYFSEGHTAWLSEAVLTARHPATSFAKARNAFATLDFTTNRTRVPAVGMVHGLLTQTYFRHLCHCVQDGRAAGQWEKRDVIESIASFYPSQLFIGEKLSAESQPVICPMQRTYIVAALGFASRRDAQGSARLWTLMQRAETRNDHRDYVRAELGVSFKNTLHSIIQVQPFIRPTTQPS